MEAEDEEPASVTDVEWRKVFVHHMHNPAISF